MNGVSQSAASQQVQELEKDFGTILLDRSTRPLAVTKVGHLYLDFCRDVLRRKDEFDAALDGLKQEVEGTVRVAAIYSVGLSEMAQLETEFHLRQPKAQLAVEYLRPEKVYSAVLADQADIGLVSYPEASRQINVIPWRQEEMVLATASNHALASQPRVVPQCLDGANFIDFDEDLPIRREIDRYLREQSVQVNHTVHFDNLQMIMEAVAHHKGVSILPARVMRDDVSRGRLAAIPLAGSPLFRPLGIIHLKKKRFHPIALAFLDLLREPEFKAA